MRLYKFLNEGLYEINHKSGKSKVKTKVPPEKRTIKNKPENVKFTEWLGIKSNGNKGYDDKYYGWSHRAVAGFGIGDKITKDTIGNIKPNTEWIIKTEEEAKKQALSFAKEVA